MMTVHTSQDGRPAGRGSVHIATAIILLAGIAFAVRCHTWPLVFHNGLFLPDMPDVYYHLRVMELIRHGTFHTPLLDRYILFPSGGIVFWPAGFDVLMASIHAAFQSLTGSERLAFQGIAFLIPALGAVSLIILFRILLEHVEEWTIAAMIMLLPVTSLSLTGNAAVGRIDHQVLETMLFAGMLWCAGRVAFSRSRLPAILMGILMGGGLWIWNGAFIYAALIHAFFATAWMDNQKTHGLVENWRDASLSALVTAALIVLLNGSFQLYPFSAVYLSFFQVTVYAIGTWIPLCILLVRRTGFSRYSMGVTVGVGAFLIAIGIGYGGPLLDILFHEDPVSRLAPESRGFFSVYTWPVLLHQPLLYLAPAAFWGLVLHIRTGHKRTLASGMMALTAILAILAAIQIRFLPAFELTITVSLAMGIGRLLITRKQLKSIAIAVLLLLSIPALNLFLNQSERAAQTKPAMLPMAHAVAWLKKHSPDTGNYLRPAAPFKRSYSVFCPDWTYGHFIVYCGHRPVLATPFGATPAFRAGIAQCLAGIRCRSASDFRSFCVSHGIRYVITLESRNLRFMQREIATGQSLSYYHLLHRTPPEDARSGDRVMPFLQLVYNSPYVRKGIPAVRIFEVPANPVVDMDSSGKGPKDG